MSTRSRSKRPTKRPRTTRSKSTAKRSLSYSGARATRTVALAAPSVGLGTSATTVLRTSFFANATSNGAGVVTVFLRPGSAFNPAGDAAAMQPQMFDQFAQMYDRYKVNSATIHWRVQGATSDQPAGSTLWHAAVYPAVDSTPLLTYQAAASQQYAKTISGGFQTVISAVSPLGVGAEGRTFVFKLNHDSILGSKADAYDAGALVTANPANKQHMVLPMFLQSNQAGVSKYVFEVDIWQNVTFSQKKNTVDA